MSDLGNRALAYITHHLACGCSRLSSGVYRRSKACGYVHFDKLVAEKLGRMSPLVSYVCGEYGYCHCGNENKLREKAEAMAKRTREVPDGA